MEVSESSSPPPSAGDIAAAEKLIMQWESNEARKNRKLFDDGGDRAIAKKYLHAVDKIIEDSNRDPPNSPSSTDTIKIAMNRLGVELRNILRSQARRLDIESLIGGDDGDIVEEQETEGSSTMTIKELVPSNAIQDLRSIAIRMFTAGYGKTCVFLYYTMREPEVKHTVEEELGVEKLSTSDVKSLTHYEFDSKVQSWIRAADICIRIVFPSEYRLCNLVFYGYPVVHHAFTLTVMRMAIRLFGFANKIVLRRGCSETLFMVLDIHETLAELLVVVEPMFQSKYLKLVYKKAVRILTQLTTDAVRAILTEFETEIYIESTTKTPKRIDVDPMTRYVMKYVDRMMKFKPTLVKMIITRPGGIKVEFPEDMSPLALHMVWIIVILHQSLRIMAKAYNGGPGSSHIFELNNVNYIVEKVIESAELRELIGDDQSLKNLVERCRELVKEYTSAVWPSILRHLSKDGLIVNRRKGSISDQWLLIDRFRYFNAAFEKAYRTQTAWEVPDPMLREELRLSVGVLLLPAYRDFVASYGHYIVSEEDHVKYVHYSEEDLVMALREFFEGNTTLPPPPPT